MTITIVTLSQPTHRAQTLPTLAPPSAQAKARPLMARGNTILPTTTTMTFQRAMRDRGVEEPHQWEQSPSTVLLCDRRWSDKLWWLETVRKPPQKSVLPHTEPCQYQKLWFAPTQLQYVSSYGREANQYSPVKYRSLNCYFYIFFSPKSVGSYNILSHRQKSKQGTIVYCNISW